MNDNISDQELEEIETRANNASSAPWQSYVEGRDHTGGDDFVMVGEGKQRGDDMYIRRDTKPASTEDQDFIAHARQDIPRLIAEIRRLRSQ